MTNDLVLIRCCEIFETFFDRSFIYFMSSLYFYNQYGFIAKGLTVVVWCVIWGCGVILWCVRRRNLVKTEIFLPIGLNPVQAWKIVDIFEFQITTLDQRPKRVKNCIFKTIPFTNRVKINGHQTELWSRSYYKILRTYDRDAVTNLRRLKHKSLDTLYINLPSW